MASNIVVRLRGGLGNQMFQWAAGYALARRRGAQVHLDLRAHPAGGAQPHLLRWQVPAQPLGTLQAWRWTRPVLAVARRHQRAARLLACHVEPDLRYDETVADRALPLLLDGYFQSERYFADARHVLHQHFRPRAPLGARHQALARELHGAVALHVRRGDYAAPGVRAVHGLCEAAYYEAAARLLAERTGATRFFVFSDNIAWARAALRLCGPTTYVEGDAHAPEVDLHLMSQAQHHVCANSSYGWWAAWLGAWPGQQVVAPARWFAAPAFDATDLVPAHWLRL